MQPPVATWPSMPGRKKKTVNLGGGQEVQGTIMPFNATLESFNEYLVDDKTIIRVKLVVNEVIRVDDAYDQQGNPVYVFSSQNVVNVEPPDELKRPKGETP
jgi:hypothetical protein